MRWLSRASGLGSISRNAIASTRYLGDRRPTWMVECAQQRQRTRAWSSQVSAADLEFGQPVHETHPHLLKAGELTPGITALEYFERRAKLADLLPDKSVVILAGADIKYRSYPVFYEFHQDSNFFYLTGFNEPEALAVIEKNNGQSIFHLFVRPKDPKAELWEGSRSGIQAALDVFNADEAGDVDRIERALPGLLKGKTTIYTDLPKLAQPTTDFSRFCSGIASRTQDGISKIIRDANTIKPLSPLIDQLRVMKSKAEIANMHQAARISGKAFNAAMRRSWKTEKQLNAFLDHNFKYHGCDATAYVPVVAGGKNALSIHYVRNDAQLNLDHLVLVDAGGEYGGYITDITRTWPVKGEFSTPQKDLYEMILKVQKSCVALCREDADMNLDKLHRIAESGLKDGLKQLGFDTSGYAADGLFPHHVGHFIGLDVHDTPSVSKKESLKEGHCITIEP